jgi:hypothetical protein
VAGGAESGGLLENDRDEEVLDVPLGSVRQGILAGKRFAADVWPEHVADLDSVGQRLDVCRVKLLQLRNELDDRVELASEPRKLVRTQTQTGQQGHLGDFLG